MTDTQKVNNSHRELMEKFMFTSHTMNIWFPLYHYWKMGGSFGELCFHDWIFNGVPKEYTTPSDEVEVMNNPHEFHEFRQDMITHLYKTYVEEWDDDELI